MLRCDLLLGLVTTQRFQRNLGFKLICKIPALCHYRIPSEVWDTPYLPVRFSGTNSLGHAKLTTTAQYTHVATKTIRDTVSPYEMIAKLKDQTLQRSLE